MPLPAPETTIRRPDSRACASGAPLLPTHEGRGRNTLGEAPTLRGADEAILVLADEDRSF